MTGLGCLKYYVFNIFVENIMQKTLTPLRQSVEDQFADNSEEDAQEVDTSLSSMITGGRPLCNLRLADDIDLLGAVKKNSNISLKDWR